MLRIQVDDELVLRVLEEPDADELFALTDRNREHLREWLPWLDGVTAVEHTQSFIIEGLRMLGDNNGYWAGVWSGGSLAGVIGLHSVDWPNRSTSIGYWLGASFQGRGLVTRACEAVMGHAFGTLGLHRVEIQCAVDNRKSRAIPERLGLKQEGVLRQAEWLYDHFVDLAVYGMLAPEWAGRPIRPAPPSRTG